MDALRRRKYLMRYNIQPAETFEDMPDYLCKVWDCYEQELIIKQYVERTQNAG